jgi:hypothetical protein
MDETSPIQVVDASIVRELETAAVMQQLDAAAKYPKHTSADQIIRIIRDCTDMATVDIETAEECRYSLPRSGKDITGPSIHMMRILKSRYGNIAIATRIIDVGARDVRAQAVCWDMETNVRHSSEVTRPIVFGPRHKKAGDRFDDDMIKVTAMAAQAIGERNALQSTIPRAIWGKVYRSVEETILKGAGRSENLGAMRQRAMTWFSARGVTEDQMCRKVGKRRLSDLDSKDITALRGLVVAIEQMETTVDEEFPETASSPRDTSDEESEEKSQARKMSSKRPAATKAPTATGAKADMTFTERYNVAADLSRNQSREAIANACEAAGIERLSPQATDEQLVAYISHLESAMGESGAK